MHRRMPTGLAGLIDDIANLRTKLADATETVNRIRELLAPKQPWRRGIGTKPLGPRIENGVELALRVAATVGTIDSRLENSPTGFLSPSKIFANQMLRCSIRSGSPRSVVTLFILWLGAGQIALTLYGYRSLRRGCTGQSPREQRIPED